MRSELYDRVKAAISLLDVLHRYGIEIPDTEDRTFRIPCPIHKGEDANFAVDFDRNIWRCFSLCQSGGDPIALVSAIENRSPREAAEMMAQWASIPVPTLPPPEPRHPVEHPTFTDHPTAVLSITWKNSQEEAERFELGYCQAGFFRGRVTFPVRAVDRTVVGYVGRSIQPTIQPKYLLSRGLPMGSVLYNLHAVAGDRVLLVEGPSDVRRLWHFGLEAVAPVGCSLTGDQSRLLERFRKVLILFDSDEAGQRGALQAGGKLIRHPWVRIGYLWKNDPGDLNPGDPYEGRRLTRLLQELSYLD
jgi:DNA primase